MNRITKILLIFKIFISSACGNKTEKFVIGVWVIDKLYYNNENVRPYFFPNSIRFKKDTCLLPIQNINQLHTKKEYGIWNIFEKNNKEYLKISTENPFFIYVYEITKIAKDCNNYGCLYRMTLKSDSTLIEWSHPEW